MTLKLTYRARCTNKTGGSIIVTDDYSELREFLKQHRFATVKVYSGNKMIDYGTSKDFLAGEYSEKTYEEINQSGLNIKSKRK